MKKILLFFFASSFFLSVHLFAQAPTLTNDNASPKPGDSYTSQSVAVAGVPTQSGGANKTWTYNNLVDSGTAIGSQAVSPSATPFADSFPTSNVVLETVGDSVYVYFTATSAALLENGVATSDSTILRSTPARTYLPYPFTYGSSAVLPVSQQVPGYDFTFTGVDSLNGDGYGTLIVKGTTYNNVLRIRYAENLTVHLDTLLTSTTTNIYTVSYIYFTPGTHAPLFTDALTKTRITSTIVGLPISFVDSSASREVSYLTAFVLPVAFQSFNASLQNKDVSIQWKTAQEINTDHFNIQRSLTGRDFQNLATVNAKGNTQGSLYNFVDNSFAGSNVPATVYYRIQETDKDGKQTLSSVALVRGDHAITLNVYPNPASNFIRVSGSDISVADAISIYDAEGHLLQQWHNYSISQPINIMGLAKGTYVVKITANGKTTSTTLLKQ